MKKPPNDKRSVRSFNGYSLNTDRRCLVHLNGHEVQLRPQSFAVFESLIERQGCVVSKSDLLDSVWSDTVVTPDSLVQCISEIRRAIDDTDHSRLRTIHRIGYLLSADEPVEASAESLPGTSTTDVDRRFPGYFWPLFLAIAIAVLGAILSLSRNGAPGDIRTESDNSAWSDGDSQALDAPDWFFTSVNRQADDPLLSNESPSFYAPSLSIFADSASHPALPDLISKVHRSLSRYSTVSLVDNNAGEYQLALGIIEKADESALLNITLKFARSDQILLAENIENYSDNLIDPGARIAALIASPGGGAIGRHLIRRSRNLPPELLTGAECHAIGFDCTNCAGEMDSVTRRGTACLNSLLNRDEGNAATWALKSTILAHQYQFGSGLTEPQRSSLKKRQALIDQSISAASTAEELSDGTDSTVYWGMAQAYLSACDVGKLQTTVERGLSINPNDPNLLGAFGNWLAYSGNWDQGVSLTQQALAIEPQVYRRWWHWAQAKKRYFNRDYQKALELFLYSFNERNWISHLQLAYTLPHLGRLEEAREAVQRLQHYAPGFTLEDALEFYQVFCFPRRYRLDMREALVKAGLPSRGDSTDIDNIIKPEVQVRQLGDWTVEFLDIGDGTPVVFVHGSMSDYRTWGHYKLPVSDKYRYVSYSRRYFGSQRWSDDGSRHTAETHAADLIRLLEYLDAGPAYLVSWSSGGPVATLAALRRPELVAGLIHFEAVINAVVSDPAMKEAGEQFYQGLENMHELVDQHQLDRASRWFLERVFEKPAGGFGTEIPALQSIILDNQRVLPLQFGSQAEPSTQPVSAPQLNCESLGRLRTPTLLLYGETTNPYWQHISHRMAQCQPEAAAVMIENVNHDGPIRDPSAVFTAIDNFIQRRQSAEHGKI